MKAIVCTKHGDPEVLQLVDMEKPAPKEHEVLIKVQAATVTQGDLMLRKLHPLMYLPFRLFGVRRKRIPGHEFAGEIVVVGTGVTRFKVGDQVFGTTTGLSQGAYAEYICLPEKWDSGVLSHKPSNTAYGESAALPVGGMTALYILRKANIESGQSVLVYGASGSVGTFAVQLAKHLFDAQVTGVCSANNMELVRSIGADDVIDYTNEDPGRIGKNYDVIFDAVGKMPAAARNTLLKENGSFVTVQSTTKEGTGNLDTLKELVEAGRIKAVIDKCFPLEQVADAHRYVEAGHKRGNVIIAILNEQEG